MSPKLRLSIAPVALISAALLGGCSHDTPEDYRHERPPVTDLDPHDRGLQSSEVVEASDLMAQKLLTLPEVNHSPRRLTVVFKSMEDKTRSRFFNYDIFLERLKVKLSEQGRDRIAVVTPRDAFWGVRAQELDPAAPGRGERDDFNQGAGGGGGGRPVPPPANRVQPDFVLTGTVSELRNHSTSYYYFTFKLQDIRSDGGGTEIPLGYEVKVRR